MPACACMDTVQVVGPTHCMSCLRGHRELLPGTPDPCALGRMLVLPKREKAVQERWHHMKRLQRPHPGSRPQPPLPPGSSPPPGQALLKAGLDGDGVGAWHQWGLLVVRLLFLQGLWQQCSRGPGSALRVRRAGRGGVLGQRWSSNMHVDGTLSLCKRWEVTTVVPLLQLMRGSLLCQGRPRRPLGAGSPRQSCWSCAHPLAVRGVPGRSSAVGTLRAVLGGAGGARAVLAQVRRGAGGALLLLLELRIGA